MIKEYTEDGKEAEAVQLWSVGDAWSALWRGSGHRIKIDVGGLNRKYKSGGNVDIIDLIIYIFRVLLREF
jgi:hypothetical protein